MAITRGAALQKVDLNLLSAAVLSSSPECTIDVGSFRTLRVYVDFTHDAATDVQMAVRAILVGATEEFVDLTATYTEAVAGDEVWYWDVPVNCTQVKLTFTATAPTSDNVTVHSSAID